MKEHGYDLLIAGAGPVGCVIANRAATELGWKSLIVEKRSHLAGNCYDYKHKSGVLVHAYGPHYFRTNDQSLLDYLSRYSAFIPGNYIVKSEVDGQLVPFPINLTTLEKLFGRSFTAEQAELFLASVREPIASPKNSEELVLSRVGRLLYEKFYLGYTLKQWGVHPRDLGPSVCGRIPIRLDRNERYVDQLHQVMPADGFTALFTKMVSEPGIEVQLNSDFLEVAKRVKPRRATLYTGPIDEFFGRRFGPLPWRSLQFEFHEHAEEFVQPCVQINHPNQHAYTRTVEYKHVTGQRHPHTVVSTETPRAEGEPYYPIPSAGSELLYARYRALAEAETRERAVYFTGRLATYRYLNTDEAITEALRTFETLRARFAAPSFPLAQAV